MSGWNDTSTGILGLPTVNSSSGDAASVTYTPSGASETLSVAQTLDAMIYRPECCGHLRMA